MLFSIKLVFCRCLWSVIFPSTRLISFSTLPCASVSTSATFWSTSCRKVDTVVSVVPFLAFDSILGSETVTNSKGATTTATTKGNESALNVPCPVIFGERKLRALPVLTYPLGRDQGEFATIGRSILDGKIPYVDLWNPKPPAVFYVYALAIQIFGRTAEALRAIDFFIVPAMCAALYWLGTRIANRRVGLFAALLFGVFYFTESFWTLTQNDGIVVLPMTLAMVCAFKAAENLKHGWIWAFGAEPRSRTSPSIRILVRISTTAAGQVSKARPTRS